MSYREFYIVEISSSLRIPQDTMYMTIAQVRLDKFWSNQQIMYDYHAEIQGTGSRSVMNW